MTGGSTGQQAFHGLQTPFTFVGMGRSNNFVEDLTIAVYSGGKRSIRTWTPVIPKSVLFVKAEMNDNADYWDLELLLNPTDKVPLVLIADGVFLLTLGLVIIVFHLKEKVSGPLLQLNLCILYVRLKMIATDRLCRLTITSERMHPSSN